jgi:hypothetical protein
MTLDRRLATFHETLTPAQLVLRWLSASGIAPDSGASPSLTGQVGTSSRSASQP